MAGDARQRAALDRETTRHARSETPRCRLGPRSLLRRLAFACVARQPVEECVIARIVRVEAVERMRAHEPHEQVLLAGTACALVGRRVRGGRGAWPPLAMLGH